MRVYKFIKFKYKQIQECQFQIGMHRIQLFRNRTGTRSRGVLGTGTGRNRNRNRFLLHRFQCKLK